MSDIVPVNQPASDPAEDLPQVAKMLGDEGLTNPIQALELPPIYKKFADSKILVSDKIGKLWQGRIAAGISARKLHEERWDVALQAYETDQMRHREVRTNTSGNKRTARWKNEEWSETENIIYSGIKSIIPGIYARNPVAEFTAADSASAADKQWVQCVETLVNKLSAMRAAPGFNLKYKIKQSIIAAKLTNIAWIECGWIMKDESSEEAVVNLEKLSEEYAHAKDAKEIKRIEGELMALEEKVSFLNPSGPYTRFYTGKDVVTDPECQEPDYSDCKWMAIADYYPTAYLNAVYGEKQEDGTYKSIYQPSVVLLSTTSSPSGEAAEAVNNFKLFETAAEAHAYGYEDQRAYLAAQRTKCWRIYDKVTRRIFLYADKKWDFPIWVSDDDVQLPTFFPLEPLLFNVSPQGSKAYSEVAYVLDQQDAVNEINDAERRARFDLQYKVLYNGSAITKTDLEVVLKGAGPTAQSVKVPEGVKIDELFHVLTPPILKAQQLFSTDRKIASIDRLLGVTPALRAAEYKTNTTNKAIEQYSSSTTTRLDEQIDEIEEFLGRIYYNIAFMCCRFMSQDQVREIIGEQAEYWRVIADPVQLRHAFSMRIVGGSTTKPTSEAKKQLAVQVGQVLGQFANTAPAAVTRIVLKMFEEAFDEVGISEEDWETLDREVAQKTGAPPAPSDGDEQAVPAQPTAAQQPTAPPPPPQQPIPAGPQPGVELAKVAALVDGLPPGAKAALGSALAKGVSISDALPQIVEMLTNSQPA